MPDRATREETDATRQPAALDASGVGPVARAAEPEKRRRRPGLPDTLYRSMRVRDASGLARNALADDDKVFFESSDACPARPASMAPEHLGFEPQPFVRWLHPVELLRAGLRALLAGLFGAYADKRELQAAIREQPIFDYSAPNAATAAAPGEDLWIDFAADVGDGFDATYTVARLLAEPTLAIGKHTTRRGQIFILGGDEVYPSATRENYDNRMRGPYRAALPHTRADHPHLYAIPGNHDWYDGLTAFLRLFAQNRWMGGWKTVQSRSYFALRLTHNYWLWGIDIQLSSDIDAPQIQYFRAISTELAPGDRVILCTAEPSWVKAKEGRPGGYKSLTVFREQLIRERGAEAVLVLTGDFHHYCRYQRDDSQQLYITAGGGGAFLHPTHRLPEKLDFGTRAEGDRTARDPSAFTRRHVFPSCSESRGYRTRLVTFPFYNWGFVAFWSAVWFVLTWVLQSATLPAGASFGAGSFLRNVADGDPFYTPGLALWQSMQQSPSALLVLLLFVTAGVAYADTKSLLARIPLGVVHVAAHVGCWLALLHISALSGHSALQLLLGSALAGLASTSLFGVFSWLLGHYSHSALDIVFSGFGIQDYRNFLRLHISPQGTLTVYPLGVRSVPGSWRVVPEAQDPAAPWLEPETGTITERLALIEEPLVLPADRNEWRQT